MSGIFSKDNLTSAGGDVSDVNIGIASPSFVGIVKNITEVESESSNSNKDFLVQEELKLEESKPQAASKSAANKGLNAKSHKKTSKVVNFSTITSEDNELEAKSNNVNVKVQALNNLKPTHVAQFKTTPVSPLGFNNVSPQ